MFWIINEWFNPVNEKIKTGRNLWNKKIGIQKGSNDAATQLKPRLWADECVKAMPENVDVVFHLDGITCHWHLGDRIQTLVNVGGTGNIVAAALNRKAAFNTWKGLPDIQWTTVQFPESNQRVGVSQRSSRRYAGWLSPLQVRCNIRFQNWDFGFKEFCLF